MSVRSPDGLPEDVQQNIFIDAALELIENHSLSRVVNVSFSRFSDYTVSVKGRDIVYSESARFLFPLRPAAQLYNFKTLTST